jgi:hypothetical protein
VIDFLARHRAGFLFLQTPSGVTDLGEAQVIPKPWSAKLKRPSTGLHITGCALLDMNQGGPFEGLYVECATTR